MLIESLLPEYDHEMGTTRRLLERVPEADFGWRPHERSMTLGELAGHLANIPTWCGTIVKTASFDLAAVVDERTSRLPTSLTALLQEYDQKVASARGSLAPLTDAELLAPWKLQQEGHEVFTLPKISAIRSFVMNHTIHHRGQLSVYLRLRNVPLPRIYGPTADEA